MNDISAFILGILLIIVLEVSMTLYIHIKKLKYIKKKINEEYGQDIDLEEVDLNMKSISSYFRNKSDELSLDDITWNDLSMDDIFKKINNTQSTAGAEILYDMLRNPAYDCEKLNNRDEIIEYFRNNDKERKEIQYILAKLGTSKDKYTTNCIFNKNNLSKSKLLQYKILSYIPILSLILTFVNKYFLILLVLSIILNIAISQNNKKYNYNTDSFAYMISLINTSIEIKNFKIREIKINFDNLDKALDTVKDIRYKSVGSSMNNLSSDLSIFSEYFKMIILTDLKNYEKVKNAVITHNDKFKVLYEFVGTIDALIGVASFRETLKYYSTPTLIESSSRDENILEFKDIYHPLIKNPVVNSGRFQKGILLTGSNASGKSTFIKTIAINSILAQTIYTTCSRYYNSSYFDIYTSMALKDDILNNESYYIVEIKSLKRIIDSIKNKRPHLCFVDEILRGTNTIERISSSCEVLRYLADSNCICFAATHDIELTHLLDEKFENYHFEEIITNEDIKFDYKLHKGRAQTRNAIKLLEFMGYDEEIVSRADNRAKKFLELGKW